MEERRTRDVHLDELAANDVETHEKELIGEQARTDRLDDLAVDIGKLRGRGGASNVDVAAKVALTGNSPNNAEKLAVYEKDPLVPSS